MCRNINCRCNNPCRPLTCVQQNPSTTIINQANLTERLNQVRLEYHVSNLHTKISTVQRFESGSNDQIITFQAPVLQYLLPIEIINYEIIEFFKSKGYTVYLQKLRFKPKRRVSRKNPVTGIKTIGIQLPTEFVFDSQNRTGTNTIEITGKNQVYDFDFERGYSGFKQGHSHIQGGGVGVGGTDFKIDRAYAKKMNGLKCILGFRLKLVKNTEIIYSDLVGKIRCDLKYDPIIDQYVSSFIMI